MAFSLGLITKLNIWMSNAGSLIRTALLSKKVALHLGRIREKLLRRVAFYHCMKIAVHSSTPSPVTADIMKQPGGRENFGQSAIVSFLVG
jgi:hypothetical protein